MRLPDNVIPVYEIMQQHDPNYKPNYKFNNPPEKTKEVKPKRKANLSCFWVTCEEYGRFYINRNPNTVRGMCNAGAIEGAEKRGTWRIPVEPDEIMLNKVLDFREEKRTSKRAKEFKNIDG